MHTLLETFHGDGRTRYDGEDEMGLAHSVR